MEAESSFDDDDGGGKMNEWMSMADENERNE